MPLETLRVAGLKGKGGVTLLKNLGMLGERLVRCVRRVLNRHQPVVAFGVGGYAAGPMLLATWLKNIPNVIFEPNAGTGIHQQSVSKICEAYCDWIRSFGESLGRESSSYRMPGPRRVFCDPTPQTGKAAALVGLPGEARALCRLIARLWQRCDCLRHEKNDLQIVHQTGERDYTMVKAAYDQNEIRAEVVPFLGNMAERFAWADILVLPRWRNHRRGSGRSRPRCDFYPIRSCYG